MKRDLGAHPYVFPMPVLMVATYCEDGTVDVMNMAWGGICGNKYVALNLDEEHKTMENIRRRGAFTLSIADAAHMAEADFFGIASANTMHDKFARSGMHAVKSAVVDAPVIEEFPVAIECSLFKVDEWEHGPRVIGEIINVSAEESILGADGKVDVSKIDALIFDQFGGCYYKVGEKAGKAWSEGKKFM